MNNNNIKVAIVTGALTGIRLATANALKQAGCKVFGTSRKVVQSYDDITMLICNVTSETHCHSNLPYEKYVYLHGIIYD